MSHIFGIVFPVIFLLFAGYYGVISFSILIKKKPVVIFSRLILILIAVSFIPAIVIQFIQYAENRDVLSQAGNVVLIVPLLLIVMFIYYAWILKGVSVYGITSDDFSAYILKTLTALNLRFTEKMNKIHLDDLDTDIAVSFAEWTGTGMIKPKDKKVDIRAVMQELRRQLRENEVHTKKTIAVFYIVFAVLMLVAAVGFAVVFAQITI